MDRKGTNLSILQQLGNVEDNLLLNTVVQWKLAHSGQVKRHDSLKRIQIHEGIIWAREGNDDEEKGGTGTSQNDSTSTSPWPNNGLRIGLHNEELSLLLPAAVHLPPR